MSGNETSAAAIELEAAQWIERREFGGWCEADEAELGAEAANLLRDAFEESFEHSDLSSDVTV